MPAEELPGWAGTWTPDPSWTRIVALEPADRPLLYAGAEHVVWVGAIEAYLHGNRRVPPALEPTQCRLGAWMSTEALSAGARGASRNLQSVHEQLHGRGSDILDLIAAGRAYDASLLLAELHSLRDGLLSELHHLLQRE